MTKYNIVVSTEEATVVAEYTPQSYRGVDYQSEASLERAFIRELVDKGCERLSISSEKDLIVNLRKQLEIVNDYKWLSTSSCRT